MTTDQRRIEYVPLQDLPPALRNPRTHDLAALTASIARFGYATPGLVDERTGRLVAGHGRAEALTAMRGEGQQPPSGIRVDSDGAWLVPVVRGWASRSDAEAEAYLIADNRQTELAGWDGPQLADLLADVAAADPDLVHAAGYTPDDLAALLADHGDPNPDGGLTDPDAVPEPPAEPITQPGDLWLLGPHRLLCGDATDPESAKLLQITEGVDLILTDPPYCSGGFQEAGRARGSVGTDAPHKHIANDRLSTRGYMALLKSALSAAAASYAYVFTDWRMWVHLFDVVESCGFGVRSMVVWDKGTPGMGRGWRSQHELIMWAAKTVPPFDKHMAGCGNVVQAKRTGNDLHTTQKPVDLLAELLSVVEFADTVYDPFAGSGSTLIACHQANRQARLVELDPAYVDVTCRRYQQHTGDKPTRADTGEPVDFVVTSHG